MILDFSFLTDAVSVWFATAALVFVRVGAMIATLPVFGEQSIPVRVRVGITVALTILVTPTVNAELAGTEVSIALIAQFFPEAVTGLLIGLGLRFFIFALQTAGMIAAQATSLSQIFGGSQAMDPQAAIGNVLFIVGLAVLVIFDVHLRMIELLIFSYEEIPAGKWLPAALLTEWGVLNVTRSFTLAFSIAAPFVVASVIYNLALGIINRAMPQLMVAMVGAPAITAGGLILLALAAPLIFNVWLTALQAYLENPFGLIR